MQRPTTWISAVVLTFAASASAETFSPAPIIQEHDVNVINRTVARTNFDRELFANPWDTATIGRVDVYDRFPYVEARTFQIVSDPEWNRLLYGELGQGVSAFDGHGTELGALRSPRGISTDEANRVYVADTDNHRVVVLQAHSEFDRMELVPLFAIEGLSRPYDVAHSDGGTPFDASDDRLYVADTGRNCVCSFSLDADGARFVAELGGLGSGVARFAGPMAITVGREDGKHTDDVYVSDAHNRRVVHLRDAGAELQWVGDAAVDGIATSLDTDHWGQVYAASPQELRLTKFNRSLDAVAHWDEGVERPRSFHVPFVTHTDHRDGTVRRTGQPNGLLVDEWTDVTGISLVDLGVDVDDFLLHNQAGNSIEFLLTDRARTAADVVDPLSQRVVKSVEFGVLPSGHHTLALTETGLTNELPNGDYTLRIRAASDYDGARETVAEQELVWRGGSFVVLGPALASSPNPFRDATAISYLVPNRTRAKLDIYDVTGRHVRALVDEDRDAGVHAVSWDGRDTKGARVAAGVYLVRASIEDATTTRKVVFFR